MQSWNRSGWTDDHAAREPLRRVLQLHAPAASTIRSTAPSGSPTSSVAYKWGATRFAVGAENLFDNFPDRNLVRNANGAFTAQSNNGIFTYPSQLAVRHERTVRVHADRLLVLSPSRKW